MIHLKIKNVSKIFEYIPVSGTFIKTVPGPRSGQYPDGMNMVMVKLPLHTLTSANVTYLANKLKIGSFIGCFMKDQLKNRPENVESGILNLENSVEEGSHWVAWYKNGNDRFYFDSFGMQPPTELLNYLKTTKEIKQKSKVVKQSSVQVQEDSSNECGALCLYVLFHITKGVPFDKILQNLLYRFHKNVNGPREIGLTIVL